MNKLSRDSDNTAKIPAKNMGEPIGYRALVDKYNLVVIPHFRWSYLIARGARRIIEDETPTLYLYDQGYVLDNPDDPFQQLSFALKHEGLNLEIIKGFFASVSSEAVEHYILEKPSGKYQRIVWYLYETLTKKSLKILDLKQGSYINLLDVKHYYTSTSKPQSRQRINDNLLGNIRFCPFIRKTTCLKEAEDAHLDRVARSIIKTYDKSVLERASTYLYIQETMSSYKIERERPNKQRLARFIQLIKDVEVVPSLNHDLLTKLQNSIVDERFINKTYLKTQNYIGQSLSWEHQIIHYISPKPVDVTDLMDGLLEALERMVQGNVHPIIIASAIAFGLVYIHPFDDGNGRLHRFLIHYILHRTGFTPQGMIFPISAIILLNIKHYNEVLEHFSKPLMSCIFSYDVDEQGVLEIQQKTKSLYQYIDYTTQAEFLAECIEKTIYTDFKKELIYLVNYDKAKKQLAHVVDMPDRLIDLFIVLTTQNKGKLSLNKRNAHFSMLKDDEIKQVEALVYQLLVKGNKSKS